MFKYFFSTLILFLLWHTVTYAQQVEVSRINKTGDAYSSYAVSGNRLLAVTDKGKIVAWDLNTFDTLHFLYRPDTPERFTHIAQDRKGNIFAGTNKGDILKVDPIHLSCSPFIKSRYGVLNMVFNSKNKMFLVVPYAVYDPVADKLWSRFKHSKIKGLKMKHKRYFSIPDVVFMDSWDRLWMSKGLGEWGTIIQLFDAGKERKKSDKINGTDVSGLHAQSFFSDDKGNTYITSGLQHFMSSGQVYKVDEHDNAVIIYDSDSFQETTQEGFIKDGLFVGPGTFSKKDGCLYFACSDGFYKASFSDAGKLKKPELIFDCSLSAKREPIAMGMKMAVTHIEFISDNKLLFLTENDGFGIYDGKRVVMFR